MKIQYIKENETKKVISTHILSLLPEWFGLEESTKKYVEESAEMPFWCAYNDQKPMGFIALKETSKYCVEIYVMGIVKEYHRQGVGSNLYKICEQYAKDQGYEYIQVKTVKEGTWKEYD